MGILWMLASGIGFIGVNGIVRHMGTDLPAAQSAFIRYAFGVAFFLPSVTAVFALRGRGNIWTLIGLRGLVHTAAVLFWFYAMARIPVAHVTAVGYLSPVILMVAGAVLLNEVLTRARIIAVLLAILGMLVALRPGLQALSLGHLSQLAAAISFAASYLCAKRLSSLIAPVLIVALLTFSVTLGLAPLALAVWVPVGWPDVAMLGIVGVLASFGHYAMSRAFALAPMAVTQPVTFLQIIWASLMGALVFGEAIDPLAILGAGLIIGPLIWVTWTERNGE
jgi:drug/metabolite transporter (DMT)-like permease